MVIKATKLQTPYLSLDNIVNWSQVEGVRESKKLILGLNNVKW